MTGNSAPGLELIKGHGITPHAAGIEANDFGVVCHALQRVPVTKNNGLALVSPPESSH